MHFLLFANITGMEEDMVSNQILQNTLEETAQITGAGASLFDSLGKQIAKSANCREVPDERVRAFLKSDLKELKESNFCFGVTVDEADTSYVVVTDLGTPNAEMTLHLLTRQIDSLVQAYKERLDKDNFIKNLILDNLLQIDIYNRAKKLHIDLNVKRAVFIVEAEGFEGTVHDIVRQHTGMYKGDFFTTVDEDSVVIVHEVKNPDNMAQELENYAAEIRKDLSAAGLSHRVSYGGTVNEIKEVSKSYKEAKLALDVGKIFYEEKDVVAYGNLGIGRLIYQLPINLCRMFITEIFGDKTPDQFDKETLSTINKFFENNLNISETSRQLFIHRNTLVYRLDKIQKTTGLDLRAFDGAITFKIALMVVKYMDYMKKIDY